MDEKDRLIAQFTEQNKLFRAECKAAEVADEALSAWIKDRTEKKWQAYITRWNKWQVAIKKRKATEPPF